SLYHCASLFRSCLAGVKYFSDLYAAGVFNTAPTKLATECSWFILLSFPSWLIPDLGPSSHPFHPGSNIPYQFRIFVIQKPSKPWQKIYILQAEAKNNNINPWYHRLKAFCKAKLILLLISQISVPH